MIRNNLSVLLSERNMKSSVLSAKTGISKNTISSLTNNDGKMIQLETINKICQVLDIKPGDFFSYLPYDFEFIFSFEDVSPTFERNDTYELDSFSFERLNFDFFVKVYKANKEIYFFELQPKEITVSNRQINITFFRFGQSYNSFKDFWETIPIAFQTDISKKINTQFYTELSVFLENYFRNTEQLNEEEIELVINKLEDIISFEFSEFDNPFS